MNLARYFRERKMKKLSIQFPEYQSLFTPEPDNEIICLDTETSGLNPKQDCLLAIGAVLIRDNKIIYGQRLDLHVQPTVPINKISIPVHGLRHRDFKRGAPPGRGIKATVAVYRQPSGSGLLD